MVISLNNFFNINCFKCKFWAQFFCLFLHWVLFYPLYEGSWILCLITFYMWLSSAHLTENLFMTLDVKQNLALVQSERQQVRL